MDLTDEEVQATRKLHNVSEHVIQLRESDIKNKIKDLEVWANNKKFKESDTPQYEYIRGKIDCLNAILENNIKSL